MKKISIGVFIFMFHIPAIWADCEKSDHWDPTIKIEGGEYDGECIITETQRPLEILFKGPNEEFLLGEGEMIVANFRHDKKFWIARIKNQAVSSVSVEMQKIRDSDFHHIRSALKMLKPFELLWDQSKGSLNHDQLKGLMGSEVNTKVEEVVVSVEAGKTESTKGQNWDPSLPAGSYPLVVRVISRSSIADDTDNLPVDLEVPIDYSNIRNPEQISKLDLDQMFLRASVARSSEYAFKYKYDLIAKNCGIEMLKIYDLAFKALYPTTARIHDLRQRAQDAVTEVVKQRLQYRGLVAGGKDVGVDSP